jgi:membrane protein
VALWGASRGASGLITALNSISDLPETRSWWRRQLVAIAVTLAVALLVVLALALLVIGPFVGHFVADRFGLGPAFDLAWEVARWLGAGLLVLVVWAIAYRFLPDTDAPFRVFTPGAVTGVLAWLGLSAAFGEYLARFNSYEATYGTLGTAIIFLTWLWLSNIAILVGAEINDVLAHHVQGQPVRPVGGHTLPAAST